MKRDVLLIVKIAAAVLAGMYIALALQHQTIGYYLIETGLYGSILFCAYKYGPGTGAVTGTLCGIIEAILYGDVTVLGILCLVGTLTGIFRKLGRTGSTLGFLCGALGGGMIYAPDSVRLLLPGLLTGTALFFLVPVSFFEQEERKKERKRSRIYGKDQVVNARIRQLASSMEELSGAFSVCAKKREELYKGNFSQVFSRLSENICGNCRTCMMGTVNGEDEGSAYLVRQFEQAGEIDEGDMPRFFSASCPRKKQYIEELNESLAKLKEEQEWKQRFVESREAVASGYKEIEEILEDVMKELEETSDVTPLWESRIKSAIRKEGKVKDILVLEKKDGRREMYMTVAARGKECISVRELAERTGKEISMHLRPSIECKTLIGKKPCRLKLVEETDYQILCGVARAVKGGEEVSGDNFSLLNLSGGRAFMGLSDGMGSGKEASKDSETAIELAEKLLESGFSMERTVALINSVLLLNETGQKPTTLDFAMVDLYTGSCEFVKLGAVPAFIKRKNEVKKIEAEALPAGILDGVVPMRAAERLEDGEMMIMVTDGVLDALKGVDKEETMSEILSCISSANPKEIARQILSYAGGDGSFPQDDMTVLVGGIWKK